MIVDRPLNMVGSADNHVAVRYRNPAPGDEPLGFGSPSPAAQDEGDAFVAVTWVEMPMKLGMLAATQGEDDVHDPARLRRVLGECVLDHREMGRHAIHFRVPRVCVQPVPRPLLPLRTLKRE